MKNTAQKTVTLKVVYFSPTGTTGRIARQIAGKISCRKLELFDITKPANRSEPLVFSANDLLIAAVPVYMGRVPDIISDWLKSLKANNTPAIAVVVYGNRTYGDALHELKDYLELCGCKVLAAAAFIGEHSFSGKEIPCSEGRPDTCDLSKAEKFGSDFNQRFIKQSYDPTGISIPGNYPYEGVTTLWDVDFIAVSQECIQCGLCAEICPSGAVDSQNSNQIDIVKCITCCACIKQCPQQARIMKPGPVKDAAVRINKLYQARKEPEVYFC